MFSPNTRVYNAANENGLSKAKKPDLVTMSVKKPFGDISVNRTTEKKLLRVKQPVFNKMEPAVMTEKSPKEDHGDWIKDISSYKKVQDSYEDILPKSQRLSNANIASTLQCLTPPLVKPVEIDPMFLTVPRYNSYGGFDFSLDPMELNDDDIPIPDIFCDFAF